MSIIYKIKKILIRLKCIFIINSKKRKKVRRALFKQLNEKYYRNLYKKSKWGVSYSVFDGEELLEASIMAIRKDVDYINVVYQLESWFGNPANESLYQNLKTLLDKGLIDELIEFKPDFSVNSDVNEINKRNVGLEYAKKQKIDYFMTMDVDEFYILSEFKNAKKYIVRNGITHSFCDIVNYGTLPTKRIISQTPSYIQFLTKIKRFSKLTAENRKVIAIVDPTRIFSHYFGAKYFFLSGIQMHHMTYVRKNISKKIQNSNARKLYPKDTKFLENLDDIYIDVNNIFNINITA